jgi:hypothetical protein
MNSLANKIQADLEFRVILFTHKMLSISMKKVEICKEALQKNPNDNWWLVRLHKAEADILEYQINTC